MLGPGSAEALESQQSFDLFRAHHYALLATLLARAPTESTLQILAGLQGDSSALGRAHAALAEAARTARPAALEREYFNLFIGVGRGEIVPYESFYLTGFLQEKPLARLRQDLAVLGVERSPDLIELEDHIAVLCEIMAGLLGGSFEAPEGAESQFFNAHFKPWAPRFFDDLGSAAAADFYKHVAVLGRTFMTIESEALALAA
ncbi:molecular chaperone TorD [Aurantimonas aggregata]|uniref:Molecular chaperone TorD n=2 Tax=Aurantimonas aggregata TaxID=2047720 RepID=A0A6L9MCD4_9HYPH|nr:molecular chaperone TorD [Aurantimonas aggregata]